MKGKEREKEKEKPKREERKCWRRSKKKCWRQWKPKSEVPWRLDVRNIFNHNKMRKKHLSVKPPPFNNRYDL